MSCPSNKYTSIQATPLPCSTASMQHSFQQHSCFSPCPPPPPPSHFRCPPPRPRPNRDLNSANTPLPLVLSPFRCVSRQRQPLRTNLFPTDDQYHTTVGVPSVRHNAILISRLRHGTTNRVTVSSFFFFILRRMGKNKALAHHTTVSSFFSTSTIFARVTRDV